MPACGYEFYLLMLKSSEISSWTLEDKIPIHKRACNILYVYKYMLGSFVNGTK